MYVDDINDIPSRPVFSKTPGPHPESSLSLTISSDPNTTVYYTTSHKGDEYNFHYKPTRNLENDRPKDGFTISNNFKYNGETITLNRKYSNIFAFAVDNSTGVISRIMTGFYYLEDNSSPVAPSCNRPTSVSVEDITQTSASLRWNTYE